MFGLASLQMAQRLRAHVSSVRLGGPGLQIPDASSSGPLSPSALRLANSKGGGRGEREKDRERDREKDRDRDGNSSNQTMSKVSAKSPKSSSPPQPVVPAPPTGKRQNDAVHTFSWRDLFDVVVRWRQVREIFTIKNFVYLKIYHFILFYFILLY